MENRNYVVNGVGFGALFEAMVAQAEADIAKVETMKNEIAKRDCTVCVESNVNIQEAFRLAKAEMVAQEAREGLTEWLTILKRLDIADAIIR